MKKIDAVIYSLENIVHKDDLAIIESKILSITKGQSRFHMIEFGDNIPGAIMYYSEEICKELYHDFNRVMSNLIELLVNNSDIINNTYLYEFFTKNRVYTYAFVKNMKELDEVLYTALEVH